MNGLSWSLSGDNFAREEVAIRLRYDIAPSRKGGQNAGARKHHDADRRMSSIWSLRLNGAALACFVQSGMKATR